MQHDSRDYFTSSVTFWVLTWSYNTCFTSYSGILGLSLLRVVDPGVHAERKNSLLAGSLLMLASATGYVQADALQQIPAWQQGTG